ncbi:hypothetical protein [Natronomonas marina]|uniref:hypothetical protein n=1 Tax=Natronomonas marina TaxID=2961939 RepID=UPI0020C9A49E|nr:hypothetical protein [Natronomonas marina]
MSQFRVLVLLVGIVAIAGCAGAPLGGQSTQPDNGSDSSGGGDGGGSSTSGPVSDVSLSTGIDQMRGVLLRVSVSGEIEEGTLQVVVSDPSDNTVGEAFIGKSDLVDGSETVTVQLGQFPDGGEYSVVILETSTQEQAVVAEASKSFAAPQLAVESIEIETEPQEAFDGYRVTNAKVTLSNPGGFPLYPAGIDIVTEEGDGFIQVGSGATIQPGNSKTFSESQQAALPPISEGQSTVEVVVRYDGRVVAEGSTAVTVG